MVYLLLVNILLISTVFGHLPDLTLLDDEEVSYVMKAPSFPWEKFTIKGSGESQSPSGSQEKDNGQSDGSTASTILEARPSDIGVTSVISGQSRVTPIFITIEEDDRWNEFGFSIAATPRYTIKGTHSIQWGFPFYLSGGLQGGVSSGRNPVIPRHCLDLPPGLNNVIARKCLDFLLGRTVLESRQSEVEKATSVIDGQRRVTPIFLENDLWGEFFGFYTPVVTTMFQTINAYPFEIGVHAGQSSVSPAQSTIIVGQSGLSPVQNNVEANQSSTSIIIDRQSEVEEGTSIVAGQSELGGGSTSIVVGGHSDVERATGIAGKQSEFGRATAIIREGGIIPLYITVSKDHEYLDRTITVVGPRIEITCDVKGYSPHEIPMDLPRSEILIQTSAVRRILNTDEAMPIDIQQSTSVFRPGDEMDSSDENVKELERRMQLATEPLPI